MSRLTRWKINNSRDKRKIIEVCDAVDIYADEVVYEACEKLAHYEDLEDQLEKLFGNQMPLDKVVDNLIRLVQNGEEKLDYARILTNAEAEKWDKWRVLAEQGKLAEVVYGFDKSDYPSEFECSVCGFSDWDTYTADDGSYNYCPRCGAKMKRGAE